MKKRFFSLLTSLIMVISLVGVVPSMSASAYTSGDYEYCSFDDGTVEIIDYYGSATNLTIPSTIDDKSVTRIGYSAFGNRYNLKSVTIPNSVISIGYSAFDGCSNLESIAIPNSITDIEYGAFNGTKWLENKQKEDPLVIVNGIIIDGAKSSGDITIPSNVTYIKNYVFYDCSDITSITIPDSVTYIEDSTFDNCINLTSITVDSNNEKYSSKDGVLFDKDKTELIQYPKDNTRTSYTIPDSVTDIRNHAFYNCQNLKTVTIPNNVTSIEYSAFSNCTNLTSITIPDSVTSIEDSAFSNCTNLTSITIPDSVTSIEDSAFYECVNLTSVTIPDSVTSIGHAAFGYYGLWNHLNLKDVYYTGTNNQWNRISIDRGNDALYSAIIHYNYDPNHTHNYTSEITKQPICTEEGVKTYTCSICGDRYTEAIPATGHNYSEEWRIDKPATCTTEGSQSHHCTVCDDITDITAIPVTEHDFGDWEVTKSATCSSTGTRERTCSICGEIEKQTIKKIEHNYKSEITRQPTCTTTGVRTYTCACGDSYTEVIPKIAHNYTSAITKQPTCTEEGVKTFTCSACGDSYTETIPATGHKYVDTVVKPTYTEKGYTLHKCSVCGDEYKDNYTAKLVLANVTGFKASSTSASAVKLTWKKSSGANGYVVYRYNTSTKKYGRIAKITSNTYTDKKLKAGTNYKYAVRAYRTVNGKELLSPSYPQLTTSTNPATVSFKLSAGTKKATVKWSKITGASGYKVYYKTSKNGSWKTLKTCNNKTTSYTKTGLSKGRIYYFTVKAYRTVGGKTYNGAYTTKSVKIK